MEGHAGHTSTDDGINVEESTAEVANNFPTTLADLHLTSDPLQDNFYKQIAKLKKSTLSIQNRLKSVLEDAEFVIALQRHLNSHATLEHGDWPLVPNERSGGWPLNPALKAESQKAYIQDGSQPVSAYFKSTDGHHGQWAFSTRRLNLPVLNLLGQAGGSILIDTTRRGKIFPDALRRTVPIWTSVFNNFLGGEDVNKDNAYWAELLNFQPFGLSAYESRQIEERMKHFARDAALLTLDREQLYAQLKSGIIRCVWVAAPPSGRNSWEDTFKDLVTDIGKQRALGKICEKPVHILVCCSASRHVEGTEMSANGYIQGAGDDSEGWSHGLTSQIFWKNEGELMKAISDGLDMEKTVADIVAKEKLQRDELAPVLIKPTRQLYIGNSSTCREGFTLVIDVHAALDPAYKRGFEGAADKTISHPRIYGLGCKEGKLGSRRLRDVLDEVKAEVFCILSYLSNSEILITCNTGRDLSVGVALALLCDSFYQNGTVGLQDDQQPSVTKEYVRERFMWITSSKPDANPSRATMTAVNECLIGRPRSRERFM